MPSLSDISPEALDKIIDQHRACHDIVFYFQRHVSGQPITPNTRKLIKSYDQMNRVLERLKKANKCVTLPNKY